MRVIRDVLGLAFPVGTTRMDAFLTDAGKVSKFDGPPVLIAASSDAALARAESTVLDFGLRIGAKLAIEQAKQRLAQQSSASAMWIELDRDCGGPLGSLLDTVVRDVRNGRYAAVVSTSSEPLEPVVARIDEPAIEII